MLIIRFSSIGDIVLTTPVARALKKQLGAEVHFLTKTPYASFLTPNPYIDKVWCIRKKVGEVMQDLRAEGFEAIIDLHNNLRSRQVRFGLKVPAHGFAKLNWEKWLLVRFKIDRLPRLHIVDRYLAAASGLGIANDGEGLDFFIPPEDEVELATLFGESIPAYGVFAIGAAHATKRLPAERIREICATISTPIVLLGGPDDLAAGETAAQAGPHVINQCGKRSVNQSASLIQQASWVISHDTGMMHIAAALRKPVISVWGNTVPAFGMYPYLPEGSPAPAIVENKGLSCRPCSKIGFGECPKKHFRCMREILPADILRHIPSTTSPPSQCPPRK